VEDDDGLGIAGERLDLRSGKAPVERHEDYARANAGDLQDHHLGTVAGEDSRPLAARRAELLDQPRRQPVDRAVKIGIGPAAARFQIDQRRSGGRRQGIGRHRIQTGHAFPP
jgi:hypothetical protein